MPIIYRYLATEIIKFFGIVMSVVVSIYLAVDFFEKIDNFIGAKVAVVKCIIFFIFKIPYIAMQISPVCVLMAVLITFCLMVRNNEILALKSSGISLFHLFRPVFILGIFFAVALFFLSELVVPATMEKSIGIWRKDVKKKTDFATNKKNIWIRGTNSITHIRSYDPVNQMILGLTREVFDRNFTLIKRIDAKKGVCKGDKWILFTVMEQNLKKEQNKIMLYDEKTEKFDFLPDDLSTLVQKPEEVGFFELFSYIDNIEAEGYDATTYRVDLYGKIAFPFVCIIMCLIGTGVALGEKINASMPAKIVIGIGIAFAYWVVHSFCVSLGYGQILPPLIAVWVANVLFSSLGLYLLLSAE